MNTTDGVRNPLLDHALTFLDHALHDAQDAFWAVIAEYHPECEFGDFPPDAQAAFDRACEDAASVWLEYNLPIITNNSEDK